MKNDYQKDIEKTCGLTPIIERRVITEQSAMHDESLMVGDIVTVFRWGTFGCWDDQGRWVDFYASEEA